MGTKHRRLNAGVPWHPTDEHRRQVLAMVGFGVAHPEIAEMLEISVPTMKKYFARELSIGATEANRRVAMALYTNAVKHNNVSAQIWWTKARMHWRDGHELTGPNGTPLNPAEVTYVVRMPTPVESVRQWIEAYVPDSEREPS